MVVAINVIIPLDLATSPETVSLVTLSPEVAPQPGR
jgi:hypothetical protein